MITLQLDPACQLCNQFKEDINKSMVVVYGDFEEEKQIFECTITCKHRAVCRLLNGRKNISRELTHHKPDPEIIKETRNAAINILAVEYLVKTNDDATYEKLCDEVYKLSDGDLVCLRVYLALNMHIENLGAMITHNDYQKQKENLLEFLDAERKYNEKS